MGYGMKRAVAYLAVVAAFSMLARAEGPDTSTPKKAGVAFAKALMAGDQAAVKALATGSEADFALVKNVGDLAIAMNKLEAASVKKFGEAGKLPKEMAIDMVADFETAEEKINGDTATLILKSKPDDKYPPTLKKDGDNWKMDLSNLIKDPAAAQMVPLVPAMVKVLNSVAKNISDDKYKTAADAFTDMGQQLGAVLAPAGAAQPAK
jgi:hypothetical protein